MNANSLLTGFKSIDPEQLTGRLASQLPTALPWVIALALGVQAAVIARNLIPQPAAPAGSTKPVAAMSGQPSHRGGGGVDVQSILNAHLFGVAAPENAASGDPADAPQTNLSLVLAGTIAANDPQKGWGIIGESAASAKVYSVGESVPGGATLNAVYTDRVILERNGQLEALALPRQMQNGAVSMPRSRSSAANSAGTNFANRIRRMVAQDPGSISEIMRPQPVFQGGQQRGYRVYPGRNRQQFEQLGLQPGDLVTAINGTPLDDAARGMEIFRTIGSSDSVRVTIERAGQQQELTLNMAQLANQAQEVSAGATGNGGNGAAPPPPPQPQSDTGGAPPVYITSPIPPNPDPGDQSDSGQQE